MRWSLLSSNHCKKAPLILLTGDKCGINRRMRLSHAVHFSAVRHRS